MDLRLYPFDRQSLEVFFHPNVYDRSELTLVPDDRLSRTWDQNMGIAEWERDAVRLSERPVEITRFDGTRYAISEFVATIDLERQPLHVLMSILLPLVVLVCLTWSVFWMDEESISNRINLSFIGSLKDEKLLAGVGLGNMMVNMVGVAVFLGLNSALEV